MSTSSNHTKAFVQCYHGKHTVASSRTFLSDHVIIFPGWQRYVKYDSKKQKVTEVKYRTPRREEFKSKDDLEDYCKYCMFWNITELLQIIFLSSYTIYKMKGEITYC